MNNLLQGKLCATVITGNMPDVLTHTNNVMAAEIKDYERMELVGQLTIQGNVPCLTCVKGDECEISVITKAFGPDAKTSDFEYFRVEDQEKVWQEGERIGKLIDEILQ